MKPSDFDYVRPGSLAEALEILSKSDGDTLPIAGGQSLLAMMNLRIAAPALIVDIANLPELLASSEQDGIACFGAAVTHSAIEDGCVPDASLGLMAHAANGLSYRAVRNRGTLGGSLALADPAAEWPTILTALDAHVVLASKFTSRTEAVAKLITGIYETTIHPDELIERIEIRKLSPDARWGYEKFSRKTGAFANSIATVILDRRRTFSRIVLGAANGAPVILENTSKIIESSAPNIKTVRNAVLDEINAASKERSFDAFQIAVHAETTMRAIQQVM